MNTYLKLEEQVERFRSRDVHPQGCNSREPQPFIPGCDVYLIQHCDCFLSLEDPTLAEKVAFVRFMGRSFDKVHAKTCNTTNPIREKYRDNWVWVTLHCNCWLSQVDTPPKPAYTETMMNDPVLSLKAKVDQVRDSALGPHLDTPIFDQLAREYDEKYRTTTYFDSALAEKLSQMGRWNHKA